MRVTIKGIATVRSKGRIYRYAWRRGPPLRGEPGSPEFMQSYNEAVENRRLAGTLQVGDRRPLARATNTKDWRIPLGRTGHLGLTELLTTLATYELHNLIVTRKFGRSFAVGATNGLISPVLRISRCKFFRAYALTPSIRSASWPDNLCEGLKQLYTSDRSEVIWNEADLRLLKKVGGLRKINHKRIELPCAPEIVDAVELGAHTGLRLGDLLHLSWCVIGDEAIVFATGKSRGRREAVIPIYDGLRDLLNWIETLAHCTDEYSWAALDSGWFQIFFRDGKAAGRH